MGKKINQTSDNNTSTASTQNSNTTPPSSSDQVIYITPPTTGVKIPCQEENMIYCGCGQSPCLNGTHTLRCSSFLVNRVGGCSLSTSIEITRSCYPSTTECTEDSDCDLGYWCYLPYNGCVKECDIYYPDCPNGKSCIELLLTPVYGGGDAFESKPACMDCGSKITPSIHMTDKNYVPYTANITGVCRDTQCTILWGDGTSDIVQGNFQVSHTYQQVGDYILALKESDGIVTSYLNVLVYSS